MEGARYRFTPDTSNCVPFEIVPLVLKKLELRIITRQRSELRRVQQVQNFTFFWIIEGVDSWS
jgi:hypothetical protein